MAPPTVPLTWRNVSAPDGSGALNAFNRAGENLGDAFEGLGGHIKQGASDYADRETQDFIADLNAAPDDATRKQMVADASQAFLKMDQVNTAVTDAEGIDIRRAGEKRAVTSAAEDTAAHKTEQDAAAQSLLKDKHELKAAKFDLKNNKDLAPHKKKLLEQQIKASESTTASNTINTSLRRLELEGKQKTLADTESATVELAKLNKNNELSDIEYSRKINSIINARDAANIADPQGRFKAIAAKNFQKQTVVVTPKAQAVAGVTNSDGSQNYSPSARNRLIRTMVDEMMLDGAEHVDAQVMRARAIKAINDTPLGQLFKDAQTNADKTKDQKDAEARSKKILEMTGDMDKLTGVKLAEAYSKNHAAIRAGLYTTEQVKKFESNNRSRVVKALPVDITTSAVFLKDAKDISSEDVVELSAIVEAQMSQYVLNPSQEEIAATVLRVTNNKKGLSGKLVAAQGLREDAIAVHNASRKAWVDTSTSRLQAEAAATVQDDSLRAAFNVGGSGLGMLKKSIIDATNGTYEDPTGFWGMSSNGKLDPQGAGEDIGKVYKAIREGSDSTVSDGDVAVLTRNLVLGSGLIGFWGTNELMIEVNGTYREIASVDAADLHKIAVSISGDDAAFQSSRNAFKIKDTKREIKTLERSLMLFKRTKKTTKAAETIEKITALKEALKVISPAAKAK